MFAGVLHQEGHRFRIKGGGLEIIKLCIEKGQIESRFTVQQAFQLGTNLKVGSLFIIKFPVLDRNTTECTVETATFYAGRRRRVQHMIIDEVPKADHAGDIVRVAVTLSVFDQGSRLSYISRRPTHVGYQAAAGITAVAAELYWQRRIVEQHSIGVVDSKPHLKVLIFLVVTQANRKGGLFTEVIGTLAIERHRFSICLRLPGCRVTGNDKARLGSKNNIRNTGESILVIGIGLARIIIGGTAIQVAIKVKCTCHPVESFSARRSNAELLGEDIFFNRIMEYQWRDRI